MRVHAAAIKSNLISCRFRNCTRTAAWECPRDCTSCTSGRRVSKQMNMLAGFRAILMFTGQHLSNVTRGRCDDTHGTWHSQDGQDQMVAKLLQFQRGGFFVDLAANQPVCLSNTRALERDYGWRGLCIEANPALLLPLATHRNCTVVGAVVYSQEEMVVFRRFVSLASVGKDDLITANNQYPDWCASSADRSHPCLFACPAAPRPPAGVPLALLPRC